MWQRTPPPDRPTLVLADKPASSAHPYHVSTRPAVANEGKAALGFKSGISRDRSAAVI